MITSDRRAPQTLSARPETGRLAADTKAKWGWGDLAGGALRLSTWRSYLAGSLRTRREPDDLEPRLLEDRGEFPDGVPILVLRGGAQVLPVHQVGMLVTLA